MAMAETDTRFQRRKRGPGVYDFVKDLILEGEDAKFMDDNGRYWINWLTAPGLYHKFRAKKNPRLSLECDPKAARKTLYGALINSFKGQGAVEYEEYRKVNNKNGQVLERQFQMPPRIFELLFGSGYTNGFLSAESETSGISVSDPEVAQEDESSLQSLEDHDYEVVIKPEISPLKGGDPFCISFTPCLGVHVSTSVHAVFVKSEVVFGNVKLFISPECLFGRSIPGAPSSGWASVIIKNQNGSLLGSTEIFYIPDGEEMGSMVHDFSLFENFSEKMICHTANSFDGGDGDLQRCGAFGNAQQVQFLRLLIYTAAREGAQQFIEMIFSTSAGRLVFNAYKDGRPLPELVARDHGHNKTACYLEEVAKRFSEEISALKEYPKTIDWSELAQAAAEEVQRKYAKSEDEEDIRGMPSHDDDGSSDYFAGTDTSSCGSVEGDSERSDSKGTFTKDTEPTEKEAPSLTPPVEPPSEETSQFNQAKDEEKTGFWFYRFRMFDRLSHTLKGFRRRVVDYSAPRLGRSLVRTSLLVTFSVEVMSAGDSQRFLLSSSSSLLFFNCCCFVIAYLLVVCHYFPDVEGKLKKSAKTGPSILHGDTSKGSSRSVTHFCERSWVRFLMCTAPFMPRGCWLVVLVFWKIKLDSMERDLENKLDGMERDLENSAKTMLFILPGCFLVMVVLAAIIQDVYFYSPGTVAGKLKKSAKTEQFILHGDTSKGSSRSVTHFSARSWVRILPMTALVMLSGCLVVLLVFSRVNLDGMERDLENKLDGMEVDLENSAKTMLFISLGCFLVIVALAAIIQDDCFYSLGTVAGKLKKSAKTEPFILHGHTLNGFGWIVIQYCTHSWGRFLICISILQTLLAGSTHVGYWLVFFGSVELTLDAIERDLENRAETMPSILSERGFLFKPERDTCDPKVFESIIDGEFLYMTRENWRFKTLPERVPSVFHDGEKEMCPNVSF